LEFLSAPKVIMLGFILIVIGIMVIIVGTLLLAFRSQGKGEFGGVIAIGPIPIIFGSSSDAVKIAVIGAIVLMVLAIVLMLLPWLLARHPIPSS